MHKSRMLVLVIGATAALLGSLSALAAETEGLKVGIEPNLKPFVYLDEKGQAAGFDVDVANLVCEKIGKTCEFVVMSWDGLIPALQSRKIDAVISGMSITAQREQVVGFTRPYYKTPSQLLRLADRPVAQVQGYRIAVLRGSSDEQYAKANMPKAVVVGYTNQNEALFDLAAGRVGYVLGPRLELVAGITDPALFAFDGPLIDDPAFYGPGIGMATRKDDADLLHSLNEAIVAIHQDGSWQTASDRYFDVDLWVD